MVLALVVHTTKRLNHTKEFTDFSPVSSNYSHSNLIESIVQLNVFLSNVIVSDLATNNFISTLSEELFE